MPSFTADILGGVNVIFGLHIALALIIGVLTVKHQAAKSELPRDKILDLCFWMFATAIVGSRLIYFLLRPGEFISNPWALFEFWKGGLTVSGGIVSALIAGFVFIRIAGLPFWKTADILAPALAVGYFFTWMGCFFSGVCTPLSPHLNGGGQRAGSDPIPLLLACSYFVILGVLIWVGARRSFAGQLICIFAALHGVFRFFSEIVVLNPSGMPILGFHSASQLTSAIVTMWAVVLYVFLWRSARNKRHSY